MRAGRLDRRVTIQNYTTTRDAAGGVVKSWSDVRTESASYWPGSGKERRESAQEKSTLSATFTFHKSTLTAAMTPQSHRLVFDGGNWDIHSVSAPDRGRTIEVTATRRVS